MKRRTAYAIAVVGVFVVAVIGIGTYAAVRAGSRTAEESAGRYFQEVAGRYADEAESAVDAGGLQMHLGTEGELSSDSLLAAAGKTPEATLYAYYYYKDRGLASKVRPFVAQDSLSMVSGADGSGMSERAQGLRGIVVDHSSITDGEATLYFRSWFSLGTKARGGRPYVGKLLKEDGVWKVSIVGSLQLTMGLTKGKDKFGFYDGTKEWWQ